MRVDLGCGRSVHRGCVGLDRTAFEGVEVVHDFREPLPFPDNSVDFLIASRSLEYADDLPAVLKEIYRVCRHLAVVCILAPHSASSFHLADPGSKSRFNEFTPFYLTPSQNHGELYFPRDYASLPLYLEPGAFSNREDPDYDFRLLRMEVFYLDDYTNPLFDAEERLQLLQSQWNAAGEILYHFAVVKEPLAPGDLMRLIVGGFEEPDRVAERRRTDSAGAVPVSGEPPLAANGGAASEPGSPLLREEARIGPASPARRKSSRSTAPKKRTRPPVPVRAGSGPKPRPGQKSGSKIGTKGRKRP